MSNPTTPFSWQMPTSTDLVTDLPADFEVFGQAVATSMADLLGGTTGQILSKASNTDMDFTWIANDQGDITAVNVTSPITGGGSAGAVTVGIQDASTTQKGAVQLSDSTSTTSSILAATPTAVKSSYDLAAAAVPKSTATAKGSIFTATASATPAQLAVGNNGETLVADSAATTGLRYSATPSASNPLINSAMQVAQRGTSISIAASTSGYSLDRWYYSTGANQASTIARQATGDTTNLPSIQYAARIQRNSGQTGTGTIPFIQNMESVNSIPFAGKTVTFSFYARRGANFSGFGSFANSIYAYLISGTGTDQNQASGFTGQAIVAGVETALTTTWQRFTYTGTVASTATQLATVFQFVPTGTAGAADYYEITGVQIDIGSVALPFRTYAATIQGELAACQRYYYKTLADIAYADFGMSYNPSSTTASGYVAFQVAMRSAPTALETNGTAADYNVLHQSGGVPARQACNAVPNYQIANKNGARVYFPVASGLTAGQGSMIGASNNTSAYLAWSAEL